MTKARLVTLTPVHIGNGIKYQHNVEFFTKNNYVYIIDPEKLLKELSKSNNNLVNIIQEWVEFIEEKNSDVASFLKKNGIQFDNVLLRKCLLHKIIKKNKELHEQIYSPINGFYIPGSSIKGAIKSCLLAFLTEEKKQQLKIDDLRTIENKDNKVIKNWSFNIVDNKIFGNYANTKLTRFIKVGDAFFKKIETKVYYTEALNADKNGWIMNKGIANLYEAIPENSEGIFDIKFDTELLSTIEKYIDKKEDYGVYEQFKNIFFAYEFPSKINEVTKQMLQNEISYFKKVEKVQLAIEGKKLLEKYKILEKIIDQCKKNEFVIRLGGNSGYNFITYKWFDKLPFFIEDEDKNEYNDLRKIVQKNNSNKDYSTETFWPRTRKITSDGIPFGFVKISLLNENGLDKSIANYVEVKSREQAQVVPLLKEPEPFAGILKQGMTNIVAKVVEPGKPNKVKLLIKDKDIILQLDKYASELEKDTLIYVKIDEFSKGLVKKVSYFGIYK